MKANLYIEVEFEDLNVTHTIITDVKEHIASMNECLGTNYSSVEEYNDQEEFRKLIAIENPKENNSDPLDSWT